MAEAVPSAHSIARVDAAVSLLHITRRDDSPAHAAGTWVDSPPSCPPAGLTRGQIIVTKKMLLN
jgi:hypothetical protein